MSFDIPQIQTVLLSWYKKNARDLPWRRTKDPYKIWVSEIMLQQTQVDTVIPYYEKWLKRFPTVEALAKSPSSEVMKYWAGLGYYRRVRMLHEAAKEICKNRRGKIPQTRDELLEIPGIGKYTAGAIASIAFDQKVPILDGNVIRILSRITAFSGDILLKESLNHLWNLAEAVLPNQNSGDFNQAMMELGATVCAPRNPSCLICPVRQVCRASKLGKPELYPVKSIKEKLEKMTTAAVILREGEKILVERQPKEGRWGGLWMFPFDKDRKSLIEKLKLRAEDMRRRITIYHGFTKYRVRLDVYESQVTGHRSQVEKHSRWVSMKQLRTLAFPSPHQKIVKDLLLTSSGASFPRKRESCPGFSGRAGE
jgi:A/G-specific adenine glycosylase